MRRTVKAPLLICSERGRCSEDSAQEPPQFGQVCCDPAARRVVLLLIKVFGQDCMQHMPLGHSSDASLQSASIDRDQYVSIGDHIFLHDEFMSGFISVEGFTDSQLTIEKEEALVRAAPAGRPQQLY